MSNEDLCLNLLLADTEEEVVSLLEEAGYWTDNDLWRYLGDNENNFGPIGNQQSQAVAALTEKLINSVDARLLNACLLQGIDPESTDAPSSIREAVARFYEGNTKPLSDEAGKISLWPDSKTTEEANKITLAATGPGTNQGTGYPSISIADEGEGQTPDTFPDTFLSLQKSNKLRVPFVQGKFNMGATGALQFCSPKYRLQLIISRRNPALVEGTGRDSEWGFTIVRREEAERGARSSVFTYLAPVDADRPRLGKVLSFTSNTLPLFPKSDDTGRSAYSKPAAFGSLVKLYEYNLDNKSNIVMSGGGLLQRLDFSLPELALPIRLYECRPQYKGKPGSFSTNVMGMGARLDRDRMDKLEEDFPIGAVFRIQDCEVRARLYALKGSAKNYRSGKNAIAFTINGQTHATKDTSFFRRKAVGMGQLQDSLVVIIDCSAIDGQLREDMFLNSRDRFRDTQTTKVLIEKLEQFIKTNHTLRELRNRRREQEIRNQIDEAKPLTEALSRLIQRTPELSRLFVGGPSIPSPFPKAGTSTGNAASRFTGKRFPTFFRFHKLGDGEHLERDAQEGTALRIKFDTDAQDDYFHRNSERGVLEVDVFDKQGEHWKPVADFSLAGPTSGIVNLSFQLPFHASIGDVLRARIRITDPSRIDSFDLDAILTVIPFSETTPGNSKSTKSNDSGRGKGNQLSSLAIPNIIPVYRKDWNNHDFDEHSALKVVRQGASEVDSEEFDFYANYDNKHLLAALKDANRDHEVLRAIFVYSQVLFSIAILSGDKAKPSSLDSDELPDPETLVEVVSSRLAPFIIPTLDAMSGMSD